jgi:hypothetical protein
LFILDIYYYIVLAYFLPNLPFSRHLYYLKRKSCSVVNQYVNGFVNPSSLDRSDSADTWALKAQR